MNAVAEPERRRRAQAERAWTDAYESLSCADRSDPLGAEDLELLACSAYMLGREDDYVTALERAHHEYLRRDPPLGAVRCAFWAGLQLTLRGESARANGWFARARRVLEREQKPCVEHGYLLIPTLLEQRTRGDSAAAHETATEAAAIGECFGDADLVALAVQEQGNALVRLGRADEGLRLLDETMVAATSGALSPIVTGLVYCNTIAFCQSVYELGRARAWTDALTRWCERQPGMVAHTGVCLVHRAEILELAGAWGDALEEARRAHERLAQVTPNQRAAGGAFYRQGEVHRLRGDFANAEQAYRAASRCGWEPQPGLALLRLAQGRGKAAAAAIRTALAEASEPSARVRLLPAAIEIMLATGAVEAARGACRELEEIFELHSKNTVLEAITCGARGAVELADGDAERAVCSLRHSFRLWQQLEVPYEAARVRALVGLACDALGDHDTAALELDAARASFAELGAATDLARVESASPAAGRDDRQGLTERELEVLRLVACGESNRKLAEVLVISEHTVARHLQNIYRKLGVSSRTAASAFAFEHQLL